MTHATLTRSEQLSIAPALNQPAGHDLTLDEALTLHRVTDTAWQVCDSRFLPHHPGYLLGFVEEVGESIELMQLGNEFIWTSFPSMRAALAHVAKTAYKTATERAAGDLAWIG